MQDLKYNNTHSVQRRITTLENLSSPSKPRHWWLISLVDFCTKDLYIFSPLCNVLNQSILIQSKSTTTIICISLYMITRKQNLFQESRISDFYTRQIKRNENIKWFKTYIIYACMTTFVTTAKEKAKGIIFIISKNWVKRIG